jgi:hypothetical protein
MPGTHRERGAEDPDQVVDKRTGQVEKPDRNSDNLVDRNR